MIPPAKTRDRSTEYTPDSDAPRRSWYARKASDPKEVLAWITLGVMALGLLGFRFVSIASLDARVTKLEQKEEMRDYILCVIVRRTDPISVPPGCDPILQRGAKP